MPRGYGETKMVKKYIRQCDCCGEEIKNLYDYGVSTLYKQIRIGRGRQFKDYQEGNIRNKMQVTEPDDYDSYGTGWKNDENKEFSFCSPECLAKFLTDLFDGAYKETFRLLEKRKKEVLDLQLSDMKKRYKKAFPFLKDWIKKFTHSELNKTTQSCYGIRESISPLGNLSRHAAALEEEK